MSTDFTARTSASGSPASTPRAARTRATSHIDRELLLHPGNIAGGGPADLVTICRDDAWTRENWWTEHRPDDRGCEPVAVPATAWDRYLALIERIAAIWEQVDADMDAQHEQASR